MQKNAKDTAYDGIDASSSNMTTPQNAVIREYVCLYSIGPQAQRISYIRKKNIFM
jgi:hypothetical protein